MDGVEAQEMWELHRNQHLHASERRYVETIAEPRRGSSAAEDLHAWSIYRQNLNSDFTDSALGSSEKSPLPFGNFQLREATIASILSNPRYGPKSELGNNMFTYLKFGLPRVFPPSASNRAASSGYDSSDDGSPIVPRDPRYRHQRSKSDPDFRNGIIPRRRSDWAKERESHRVRSSSEANLLTSDAFYGPHRARSGRASRALSETHLANRRPPSKAGSHLSLGKHHLQGGFGVNIRPDGIYSAAIPMLNDKFFPRDAFQPSEGESPVVKHPHLQVRGMSVDIREGQFSRRILDGITFEVRGGELMAIMVTSELEGTAMLDMLAGTGGFWNRAGGLRGEIIVNGSHLQARKLRHRVAYVQQNQDFQPNMSVRQTLLFHAFLREPGNAARDTDTKGRINALIEDLGLSQVRHTRVHDLTLSEKLRLNVACHLLLETDLIFLDQPTKGMDIFDTFFLVEYLRQWALRGRIVVTTLNPPTYEIFTMVSRVALLSTGRLMYCGKRREMLPYFAFIEYPCPAYKNPADYYLDLVTLDDLSAEAMLESSQRVKQLAEIFKRRQEPLSDPGPPGVLPPKVHSAGCMTEFLALWVRAMVYTFPNNVIAWAFRVLLAAILSLCIGTIWFDTRTDSRQEQMHVNDRLGFHYLMMGLGIWPSILLDLSDAWSEKAPITRDVSDGLYSKVNFIFCKMLYSTPAAFGVFLAYLIPAYALSGLQGSQGANTFLLYLGFMLLYLYTVRSLALACVYLFSSRHVAAVIVGTVTTLLLLPSGYAIHTDDLQPWVSWLAYASPSKWMYQEVVVEELRSIDEFKCSTNPPTKQEDIIYQLPCGVQTGRQALSFMAFNTKQELILPLLVTGGFLVACHILSIFFFLAKTQLPKRSRSKLERM